MKLHFVETMDQVLQVALEGPLPKILETPTQPIGALTPDAPEAPSARQ
jgi:ATP-dependent Lon protease